MIGSRNVFSPLNTPAMKAPSGLVSARTTARNNAICSQPFAVMVKTSPATARPSPDSRRPEYKPEAAGHCPAWLRTSLLEPLAAAHIGDRRQKEGHGCCDEQEVVHPHLLSILWKCLDASGKKTQECPENHRGPGEANSSRMSKSLRESRGAASASSPPHLGALHHL